MKTPPNPLNTIFCIGFWPDYENLFFNQAHTQDLSIKVINPSQALKASLLPVTPKPMRHYIYQSYIKQLLLQNPQALFIFQEERFLLSILISLKKHFRAKSNRIAILMRNIYQPQSKLSHIIKQLQRLSVSVFSFDQNDCQQYRFIHYTQFADRITLNTPASIDYDFSFVGKDKGRSALLSRITSLAEALDYSSSITLINDRSQHLTYLQYLSKQLNSRCIIDINQTNQQGLTLRPIEAMLYHKKLITNNLSILDSNLYHPNNVLIMDDNLNKQTLRDFMSTPYQPLPETIKQQYLPITMLQQVKKHMLEHLKTRTSHESAG